MPPRALRPTGLVLVDKPVGPSSFAVVRRLRDRTGARAGHAGTLDPFATGLLLVLLGSATRLAQYLVGLDKRYVTEIDLRRARRRAIPRERSSRSSRRLPADELAERVAALARGDHASSAAGVGGQDRRRARLPPVPAGRGGGDAVSARRPCTVSRSTRTRRAWRPSSSPSPPGRTCARSRTRSAVTADALRRTEVGPVRGRRCRRGADPRAG